MRAITQHDHPRNVANGCESTAGETAAALLRAGAVLHKDPRWRQALTAAAINIEAEGARGALRAAAGVAFDAMEAADRDNAVYAALHAIWRAVFVLAMAR